MPDGDLSRRTLEEHVAALNREVLSLEKAPEGEGRAEHLKRGCSRHRPQPERGGPLGERGPDRDQPVIIWKRSCRRRATQAHDARPGPVRGFLFGVADAIEEAGMRPAPSSRTYPAPPLAALMPRLEAAVGHAAHSGRARLHAEPEPPARQGASPSPSQSQHENPSRPHPTASERPRTKAPAPTPRARPAVPPPAELQPEPAAGTGTIRVAAEKLRHVPRGGGELLLWHGGEVESRVEDVAAVRELIGRWKAEWRAVEKPLAQFMRVMDADAAGAAVRPATTAHDRIDQRHRAPVAARRAVQALGRVGNNLRPGSRKTWSALSSTMAADGACILKEAAEARSMRKSAACACSRSPKGVPGP